MNTKNKNNQEKRWTAERAWNWYQSRPWLCGFNFFPSTAINSTEMWQCETFDPETINRELGWAEDIGLNSCRVFLQYLVGHDDSDGLIERMDRFLKIANNHGISTMFCLFTNGGCSQKEPYLGKQDDPIPGVHNSRSTPSPGYGQVVNRSAWPELENFVTAIVSHFATDERILAWDIFNEPSDMNMLLFVREAFGWARSSEPEQPLTTATWSYMPQAEVTLELSDIITFHNYDHLAGVQAQSSSLKSYGRPVVCTEWMARHRGSLFKTHLPFFKREKIGCYCWGLVKGKTQTHFPWWSPSGASEPDLWFHDLLYPDGKFYRKEEIEIIREYTQSSVKEWS